MKGRMFVLMMLMVGLSGWAAWGQVGSTGTVQGCVGNSGIIRGVDESTGSCKPGDTSLSWYTKAGADGAFALASHNHDSRYLLQGQSLSVSLANLNNTQCMTPANQLGVIEITETRGGVVILQCRSGTGRFIDNGDGTVTDTQTRLMWERKVTGANCLHCVDDDYEWADARGDWLAQVNGRLGAPSATMPVGLGGYSDWRLPTVSELQSIAPTCVIFCVNDPLLMPALSAYWSDTEAPGAVYAWFGGSTVGVLLKTTGLGVRAVRGGM